MRNSPKSPEKNSERGVRVLDRQYQVSYDSDNDNGKILEINGLSSSVNKESRSIIWEEFSKKPARKLLEIMKK